MPNDGEMSSCYTVATRDAGVGGAVNRFRFWNGGQPVFYVCLQRLHPVSRLALSVNAWRAVQEFFSKPSSWKVEAGGPAAGVLAIHEEARPSLRGFGGSHHQDGGALARSRSVDQNPAHLGGRRRTSLPFRRPSE